MECTPDTKSIRPQRKQLAHHTPVERHNQPIIVFVTLTITPRGDYLANRDFCDAFLQACGEANAWSVGCYMIMPDHYHEKWVYVRQNPVRKALVTQWDDWPWQGELHDLRW